MKVWSRADVLVLLLCLLAGMPAQAKLFGPDNEPWAFWQVSDAASATVIDHSEWQALLDSYLVTATPDGIFRFNYAAVTASDRQRLVRYIDELTALDPRALNRAEQRAYWINLYNALTVEVVLRHYPVKSIKQIQGGLFDSGPWDEPYIDIAGVPLTLNDIEHRILRPQWRDPRIHYALNCASLGCPNLAVQAYTAANTELLLELNAVAFINSPRGVTVVNRRVTASSIYDWFADDFGPDEGALLEHWLRYAAPELAAGLGSNPDVLRIKYRYDWALNAEIAVTDSASGFAF